MQFQTSVVFVTHIYIYIESANTVSRGRAVLLRPGRTGSPKSERSAIRASASTGRYRCGGRTWGFADRRQWSAGDEHPSGDDREQGRFVVDRWPGDVAQVLDVAEHAEGVQSTTVRVLDDGWFVNGEVGQVRGRRKILKH